MGRNLYRIAAILLAGSSFAGGSAQALAQGNGSGTDNPDLLRGPLGFSCSPGTLCDVPASDLVAQPVSAPLTLAAPVSAPPAATTGFAQPATPVAAPAVSPHPIVDSGGFGDLHYGMSLRGAYVRTDAHERFELIAIPEFGLSRHGGATDLDVDASLNIVLPTDSDARVSRAELGATVEHRLSPSAGLSFDTGLALHQDDPTGLTVDDADVAIAPQTLTGHAQMGYVQRFGRFNAGATLELSRNWVGDTTRIDGTTFSNDGDSYTRYEGGVRVGYAVTPLIEVFGAGEAGRSEFDAVDPGLGVFRTSSDLVLRGGIAANWQDVLTLEASVGSGWRQYDAAGLADAQSWLYAASLGYQATATTRFTTSFETDLTPGHGAYGGAITRYGLDLGVRHIANSWLTLRGNAGAAWLVREDGSEDGRRYNAGLGAELVLGPHSTATLDYDYAVREDYGATPTERDEHRISAGVSLRY